VLMVKIGLKVARKRALETLAISLMVAFALSLYASASVLRATLLPLFGNYLRMSYGDVIVIGYIPYQVDRLFSTYAWVEDFTGYAVVPSYGSDGNRTFPLLLGYTEAAYRKDTLLGGFKAPPLRKGEAVLLREGSSFLRPGMTLEVYPMITLRPVEPFRETIVGYAEGGLPLPAGPVLFLNEEEGKRLVLDFGGYTVYSVSLKEDVDGSEALDRVLNALKKVNSFIALTFYSKDDLLFYPGEDVILETSNVLQFLSTVSWSVVTVVLMVIAILYIERNVREVASLRALGASKRDMGQYLLALWGTRIFVGAVLALVIGYLFAVHAVEAALSHPRLQPLKGFVRFNLYASDILIIMMLALLTTLLTVAVSMLVISRMNVVEALRFYGIRIKLKVESSLPFNVMVALSEIRSVLWRASAALVLLSLSLSLIVVPLILGESLKTLEYPKSFDVSVTFLRIPRISPPVPFVLEQLKESNHTKSLSLWIENLYGSVNFKATIEKDGRKMSVFATSCVEALKGSCADVGPKILQGRRPKGLEIAVSDLLSNIMNIKVNDTVRLIVTAKEGTWTYDVRVSGIMADPAFPPSIMLPKELLPKKEYNVFTVYATADDQVLAAKELQGILIGNAYAAGSTTWESFKNNLKMNINFVATSVTLTTLINFSIIILALLTFTFSDVVIKSKLLAILKALGATSLDYYVASFVRWGLVALLASVLTPLLSYSLSIVGISVLSQIYLIKRIVIDWNIFLLPLLSVPLLALLDSVWFRRVGTAEAVKEEG